MFGFGKKENKCDSCPLKLDLESATFGGSLREKALHEQAYALQNVLNHLEIRYMESLDENKKLEDEVKKLRKLTGKEVVQFT